MKSYEDYAGEQKALCAEYGLEYCESPAGLKVGVAQNVREGLRPFNGLRHQPEADTTGWYLWAGEELSDDPDFFQPLHVEHLVEWCPGIIRYLGLPPGWRFLADLQGHEDVWEDLSTLVS